MTSEFSPHVMVVEKPDMRSYSLMPICIESNFSCPSSIGRFVLWFVVYLWSDPEVAAKGVNCFNLLIQASVHPVYL